VHKLVIDERLIAAVMSMNMDARTMIRIVYGSSKVFGVGVGIRQGSGLSPLLFYDCHGSDF